MLSFKLWEGHLKDIEGVHACNHDLSIVFSVNICAGKLGNGPVSYFVFV